MGEISQKKTFFFGSPLNRFFNPLLNFISFELTLCLKLTSGVSLVDRHLVEEALAEQLHVAPLGRVVERTCAPVVGVHLQVVAGHLAMGSQM